MVLSKTRRSHSEVSPSLLGEYPAHNAKTKAWFRLDQNVVLNGTTVFEVGDILNNYKLRQTTKDKQPSYTFRDSNFNNTPSMTFDGVNDFMSMIDTGLLDIANGEAAGLTIFIAMKNNSASTQYIMQWQVNDSGSNRFALLTSLNKLRTFLKVDNDATNKDLEDDVASYSSGDTFIFTSRSDFSGLGVLYKDGAAIESKPALFSTNTLESTTPLAGAVGANQGTGSFFSGEIAEIIIVKNPTDSEINEYHTYLGNRHGRSVSLVTAPQNIPDLTLMLQSNKGVTLDTTLSTDTVSNWANQATDTGSGYDATQGTKANQPELVPALQNGLPALRFDGSNDNLVLSGTGLDLARNVGGLTIYMVAKHIATNKTMLWISSNSSPWNKRLEFGTGWSSGANYKVGGQNPDDTGASIQNGGGSTDTTNVNMFRLKVDFLDAALGEIALYKNQGWILTANGWTPTISDNTASSVITIGSQNTINYANIDLYAILVYKRLLTSGERTTVEDYLKSVYNI